ncbi:STY4528 family pathogenicity island replication protein [Pseudomonas sp. B392_1p]|uniref:STY4528 family pathogenicity island replication protein n=1 Tax=Pseudomonas sp. B392_1p TaxID=3457507 RepID=UPI003FD531DD
MVPPSSPSAGPTPLSALLDSALQHFAPGSGAAPAGDGFLFSGNRHESVPRALFLDRRLTPLERNAWQVFRLMLNDDGVTAFPTYDQLRPYLASTPCAEQASHETVARALTLLRLTRWLSLVRRRRDPKTGRIRGNLYVLHDEPLTPFEAMQLDPEYLGLVSHALTHASKAIQRVSYHAIQELGEDPMLCGRSLPTRIQVLAQRMAQGGMPAGESYPQAQPIHDSEEGADALLRNREVPSSDSEAGPQASKTALLRNPKWDRTEVHSNRINKSVRTVPRAREFQNLRLPERFLSLKNEQQAGALVALQQVEADQRQAVLDEWDVRCRDSAVRKPAGYLFGVIQKAIRGEFKAWAAPEQNNATAPPPATAYHPADPEVVKAHLASLHALLNQN